MFAAALLPRMPRLSTLDRYRFRAEASVALLFMALLEIGAALISGPSVLRVVVILLVSYPVGLLIGVLEVRVLPRFLARRPLPVTIGLALSLHLLLSAGFVVAGRGAVTWLQQGPAADITARLATASATRFTMGTWEFAQLLTLYGLSLLATILAYQISRKIGPRVLLGLLTGRYLRPVAKHRIFLFLDVKNSTGLAEQLGEERYSQLISDFFQDLSAPVVASRGEIYQYVGDGAVLTWPTAVGAAQARCLECFFAFTRVIAARQAYYRRRYGVVPEFKAGAHLGRVMATQVGDVKSELVYHGDALNTTARIQAECNTLGNRLLVSQELRERLGNVSAYELRELGQRCAAVSSPCAW
jgi:adenylate cyclase